MHKFELEEKLLQALKKLARKDKKKYEIICKKISEIISCENIDHYKNLKFPLNSFKRVHVDNSFVLTFKHDKTSDKIMFFDLNHHDKIYK